VWQWGEDLLGVGEIWQRKGSVWYTPPCVPTNKSEKSRGKKTLCMNSITAFWPVKELAAGKVSRAEDFRPVARHSPRPGAEGPSGA